MSVEKIINEREAQFYSFKEKKIQEKIESSPSEIQG